MNLIEKIGVCMTKPTNMILTWVKVQNFENPELSKFKT